MTSITSTDARADEDADIHAATAAVPRFVHLRLHTEYSITDSVVRIDDAVALAADDGMPAMAITDLANMFGMVKFYKAARAKGLKAILGCDLWLTNPAERDKPHRVLVLVQSRKGYLRLSELLSRAWLENQHRGRAEFNAAWFSVENGGSDGLLLLSGGMSGDVGAALLQGNLELGTRLAGDWAALFPGRFYIELQRAGMPQSEAYVQAAVRVAANLELPVVATHPVQFISPEEFTAHEARVCIAEGFVLADQRRPKIFTTDCYFKSSAEMSELFSDLPEALANSVEIARRCSLELELGKSKLPLFPTPDGMSLDDFLVAQAREGLGRRMEALYPDPAARAAEMPRYEKRLEFEAKTIIHMGFPGYFLIVADFINWAKQSGIPVGPGRGSGAGSLVAFSLGITDLDPLRYDLLFERFLNPERVSMPDFDIDFCQEGRDRVIDYVKQKYGRESVSQIATFGTMASKAVVRDVGRVLEWGYGRTDELAKLIPFQPGKTVTLRKRTDPEDTQTIYAREAEPQINQRESSDEDTRELLALAEQLEGLGRNVGMHAGGVLIAPGKLTDFCPLYVAAGSDSVVSQLDKDDVEAIGLVKFDFLGLTTLTILDWAIKHLHAAGLRDFSLERIPLDDKAAYHIFSSANTTAVFQFESRGMRDLLKRARPDRFGDIIALVALYRPGPMELIPEYCDRKHGKQVEYPDPRVENVLSETDGIMVYQEQVMQMAQIIGGYSLGGADLLRRAMGKKKPEEMAEHRSLFGAGAAKNGLSESKSNEIFDLMEKFAGYGFNKSHAAAYALVAYQTAYMKAHHPAAFMAANMSAMMGDTDKVKQFVEDSRENGLAVLSPDINTGGYRFEPVDEKTIRYGLGAVKGTGESAIAEIVAAREGKNGKPGGPFKSLYDFCARLDKRIVNRRSIEALVRAGAFDSLDDHRASVLATVGRALEAADQAERNAQQVSLFGAPGESGPMDAMMQALIETPRWNEAQRLIEEKLALGYYLTGHPFRGYAAEVRRFVRNDLKTISPGGGENALLIAGVVETVRAQRSQSGKMMIVLLSDGAGAQEVSVYSEVFEKYRNVIKEDALLVMEVKVKSFRRASEEGEETTVTRISAERVYDFATARSRFARSVRLSMNGEASKGGQAAAAKLKQMLTPYRNGGCPVAVRYRNGEASVEMQLGDGWRVSVDERLLTELSAWLKPENVEVVYS